MGGRRPRPRLRTTYSGGESPCVADDVLWRDRNESCAERVRIGGHRPEHILAVVMGLIGGMRG